MYTHTNSDVTLLRLFSVPADRWFLGLVVADTSSAWGAAIHHVHHPNGRPAMYTLSDVVADDSACPIFNGRQFFWSAPKVGGTQKGSSGAAALLNSGQIVGQLYGSCFTQSDRCARDGTNLLVDGDMWDYWPAVAPFLNPSQPHDCTISVAPPWGGESYVGGEHLYISWDYEGALCSNDVTLELWNDGQFDRTIAIGKVDIPDPPSGTEDPFADFSNPFFWHIPAGVGTSSEYRIRVVDTLTGSSAFSNSTFSLSEGPDDNYESNDNENNAFDLSEWEGRWLSDLDGLGVQLDNDWYLIEVSAENTVISVTSNHRRIDGYIDVSLHDPKGWYLAGSFNDDNLKRFTYLAEEPGTYFIYVTGSGWGNYYELRWDEIDLIEFDPIHRDSFESANQIP